MKSLILAGATAVGLALLGTAGASAAPANGIVIDRSAAVIDQAVPQEVGGHGRWRSHARWGSRGGHWRYGSRRYWR
jgi:hypothetical protein